MRMVSAISQALIEDAQENFENGIFFVFSICAAVDIKENYFSIAVNCSVDITVKKGIADFSLKNSMAAFVWPLLTAFLLGGQDKEDLYKVRFTGTEITRYPNPNFTRHTRIIWMATRQVGLKKVTKVAVSFTGHHVLVKLSPDDLLIQLLGFHHTIDSAMPLFW